MSVITVVCTVILLTLVNSHAEDVATFDVFEESLQDIIADYKVDASALIAAKITRRQLLIGLTQSLRDFRLSLSDLTKQVHSTPAERCITNASYNLYDVSTIPNGIISQITNVNNVSFVIAEFYSYSFFSCSSTFSKELQDNVNEIPDIYDDFKELVENGEVYIPSCVSLPKGSYTPSINQTRACVNHYRASLEFLRSSFFNAINGDDDGIKDFTDTPHKYLFRIPNCLLYAIYDAVRTGDLFLQNVKTCAETIGVQVNVNETIATKDIPHIETNLNFLEHYYANKNNNTLDILTHYGKLALFYKDLEEGRKFRDREQVVDSIYYEISNNATAVASKTDDAEAKACISDANTYLKETIEDCDYVLRQCADTVLRKAEVIFNSYKTSLQTAKQKVNTEAEAARVAQCISDNLFNSDTLSRCFSSINLRKLGVENEIDIEQWFKGDSIEYSCKQVIYRPDLPVDLLYACGVPLS